VGVDTVMLIFSVVVLFIAVIALSVALLAVSRQVGVLFERIEPMGALVVDPGLQVGQAAPRITLQSLTQHGEIRIGERADRATLLFFLSPSCPVCKKLLPILKSVSDAEGSWLTIVLASDGEPLKHAAFIKNVSLESFPYVLSTELGRSYRASRLPFAVLIDNAGQIRGRGLVNNREQLESLFNAHELGVTSVQEHIASAAKTFREAT
jgi:methylamine dehydrogenase accessory protein MauD